MSDDAKSTIPITVELSAALSALTDAKGIQAFERRLAAALSTLVEQVGLSGEPSVTVRSVDSCRAVRVRVHETLQPYDPNLMKRVWLAVATADLRSVAENQEAIRKAGFPDQWFTAFVANLAGSKSDLGVTFEFLTRLVIEIIAERPHCLVGPAQATAFITTRSIQPPETEPVVSPEDMSSLLILLLDMGLYVTDKHLVWQAITVGRELGRSVEDIVESVFTQARSPQIRIHVHPDYLTKCVKVTPLPSAGSPPSGPLGAVRKFVTGIIGSLAQQSTGNERLPVYSDQVDESTRSRFREAEEFIFKELGLLLPEIVFVGSSETQEGMIAVKINDRLGPPFLGLQPDELFVNASVEQLMALNVSGRRVTNPASDEECAIVSEVHKEIINQGGFNVLDGASFVALVLTSEVKRQAARLLGVEDVEYQLAELSQVSPTLIHAVSARFSVEDLTRVMRGLVAEGVSVRDAVSIFERLLQFDTITVRSTNYVSFDERFELRETNRVEKTDSWQNLREFVRSGLKRVIRHSYNQDRNLIRVYPIESKLQDRAEAVTENGRHMTAAITWLDEAEQEALRDAIWTKVSFRDTGQGKAPIMTSTKARTVIRQLIAPEMSNLPVIARSEIGDETEIRFVDTIGLDQ